MGLYCARFRRVFEDDETARCDTLEPPARRRNHNAYTEIVSLPILIGVTNFNKSKGKKFSRILLAVANHGSEMNIRLSTHLSS